MTHTYAELEVPGDVYDLIRAKFEAAGYQRAFLSNGAIDMHGIGLMREPAAEAQATLPRRGPFWTPNGVWPPDDLGQVIADASSHLTPEGKHDFLAGWYRWTFGLLRPSSPRRIAAEGWDAAKAHAEAGS